MYARARNIIKNGGATRGRYAGTRFLRIMRFTAACKYTLVGARSLMAKTVTLKEQVGGATRDLLTSMSL